MPSIASGGTCSSTLLEKMQSTESSARSVRVASAGAAYDDDAVRCGERSIERSSCATSRACRRAHGFVDLRGARNARQSPDPSRSAHATTSSRRICRVRSTVVTRVGAGEIARERKRRIPAGADLEQAASGDLEAGFAQARDHDLPVVDLDRDFALELAQAAEAALQHIVESERRRARRRVLSARCP